VFFVRQQHRLRVRGLLAAVSLAAAALALVLAASADAYIYWINLEGHGDSGQIGRAHNNGAHPQPDFIADTGTVPQAVTADARHVYWVTSRDGIGRARIDGTKVEPKFIKNAGYFVRDLVTADGYIYWTNDAFAPAIGRARANGSGVDKDFIPLRDAGHGLRFSAPLEIAIAGDYLYWANAFKRHAIGRARLDGTELDREFVYVPHGDPYEESLHNPFGLAATDSYVYWSDRGSKSIGRAATDGSAIDTPFIPDVGKYVSSLAADDTYLYWTAPDGLITRSRLDGTRIKTAVKHGVRAQAVFVDRLGP
jgi:hypothetical protein